MLWRFAMLHKTHDLNSLWWWQQSGKPSRLNCHHWPRLRDQVGSSLTKNRDKMVVCLINGTVDSCLEWLVLFLYLVPILIWIPLNKQGQLAYPIKFVFRCKVGDQVGAPIFLGSIYIYIYIIYIWENGLRYLPSHDSWYSFPLGLHFGMRGGVKFIDKVVLTRNAYLKHRNQF